MLRCLEGLALWPSISFESEYVYIETQYCDTRLLRYYQILFPKPLVARECTPRHNLRAQACLKPPSKAIEASGLRALGVSRACKPSGRIDLSPTRPTAIAASTR